MLVREDPIRKKSVQRLFFVISVILNKLNGDENIWPMREHFNRVVRDVKIFRKDTRIAKRFDRETYELAKRMAGNEALERIIMNIDTIDDVDKDTANQILQILEPAYARPRSTNKLIA